MSVLEAAGIEPAQFPLYLPTQYGQERLALRQVGRPLPLNRRKVRIRTTLEQQHGELLVAILGCGMQSREAALSLPVDVRASVQQQLGERHRADECRCD